MNNLLQRFIYNKKIIYSTILFLVLIMLISYFVSLVLLVLISTFLVVYLPAIFVMMPYTDKLPKDHSWYIMTSIGNPPSHAKCTKCNCIAYRQLLTYEWYLDYKNQSKYNKLLRGKDIKSCVEHLMDEALQ